MIEPFVPHSEEYYIAIKTEREFDVIFFSENGGIDVEENWDQVQSVNIPLSGLVIAKNEAIQVSENIKTGLLRTSQ